MLFFNYQFDLENLPILLKFLSRVGPFIKELTFHSVDNLSKSNLFQLLSLFENVGTLNFSNVRIFESHETEDLAVLKFPRMKKLCLTMHNYYDTLMSQIFQDAPNVEDLELCNCLNVLRDKPKLKKLQLTSHVQNEPEIDFEVLLDDAIQLTDLKLVNFLLKRGKAFENFKTFIEKQKEIQSIDFIYTKPPIDEYSSLISHILNQESLNSVRTVSDAFRFFPGIHFRNHRVKKLSIECRYHIRQRNYIEEFVRIFPSVTSLWISVFNLPYENILQINNLNHLEELSIARPQVCQYANHQRFTAKEILDTIQVKNLKKFSLSGCEPESFNVFNEHNPNIIEVTLELRRKIDWDTLSVLLINGKLRKLVIRKICGHSDLNFDWEERIFEVIGEFGENLEHFDIDFGYGRNEVDANFAERAKNYLRAVLPNLTCNFEFKFFY